jgi:hypothetical protein
VLSIWQVLYGRNSVLVCVLLDMSVSPFSNAPILLWGSLGSLHCFLRRCPDGLPFEISVFSGALRIKLAVFEHDQEASDFAIAEMKISEDIASPAGFVPSVEPPDPSDPSSSEPS